MEKSNCDSKDASICSTPCVFFQRNRCRYGDECRHAHSLSSPPPCVWFLKMVGCDRAERCSFTHDTTKLAELRERSLYECADYAYCQTLTNKRRCAPCFETFKHESEPHLCAHRSCSFMVHATDTLCSRCLVGGAGCVECVAEHPELKSPWLVLLRSRLQLPSEERHPQLVVTTKHFQLMLQVFMSCFSLVARVVGN